ncbi:kinase-like domain-containing protein [Mycena belliarum]|uniref:Kinase-like domain-containing protein n=1 Tax=Mycena belliarum TaxID=1033014 RepID=A0AAD6XQ56_9AGAR|nr:kinase-like domain-containing protein [Mycena belliae]
MKSEQSANSLTDEIVEEPGGEFSNTKVYQHLISFITQVEASQDARFRANLEILVQFMASLDPVWRLVQSSAFRVKLLKISAILGISNDQRLRDELHKDDKDLAQLLVLVASSDVYKKAVLRLKGGSAQNCIDLIQDILDKGSIPSGDEPSIMKARRLLVRLSEASDTLPSSLFIRGVSRLDKEATFGGTFGDIYRATFEGQTVALKRIRVFQRDSAQHKRFCREALLWQRLQSPFVLPFTGIDAESFPSFLCMVSPFMRHGTILKHLAENGNANLETRLFEIAQGLAYLHSQNIIHGDLRGCNILVDDGWHACLADFGLAVFSDATGVTHTSHHGGSVRWMSPELHYPQSCGLENFQRTFASDVYSFAFVCVELYTGKPPFSDISHDAAVMLRVIAKERPPRPCDVSGRTTMSDALWTLVQQCWSHDPAERPSMAWVLELMQDGNEELHLIPPSTYLQGLPNTPPGKKQSFQVHLSSRRRPKGPGTTVYQTLSF